MKEVKELEKVVLIKPAEEVKEKKPVRKFKHIAEAKELIAPSGGGKFEAIRGAILGYLNPGECMLMSDAVLLVKEKEVVGKGGNMAYNYVRNAAFGSKRLAVEKINGRSIVRRVT